MKQLISLVACLGVLGSLALPASAQPSLNRQSQFGNPGLPSWGQPEVKRTTNPPGRPIQPDGNSGPTGPWKWNRPDVPEPAVRNPGFPGGQQGRLPKDIHRFLPPVNPMQPEKDRDEQHRQVVVPHFPDVQLDLGPTVPQTPKMWPPQTAVPSPESPGIFHWLGFGCIGGALAALFAALFGRKKES